VRDRIPEIVAADGRGDIPVRVAAESEYDVLLEEKLREEVAEYLSSRQLQELADILEVVYALAERAGTSQASLEGIRLEKFHRRGGFRRRYVMDFE